MNTLSGGASTSGLGPNEARRESSKHASSTISQQFIRWHLAGSALRASSKLSASTPWWAAFAPAKLLQGGGPPGGDSAGGSGGGGGPQGAVVGPAATKEPVVLTLASFAVTKLAYVRLTKRFREQYMAEKGIDVRFRLTFAGSGVQARAVIDGLPAELVALALPLDIDRIAHAGLISEQWRGRYPCNSTVCETTVALVVRAGNPKNIQDWSDLIRPGVEVVLANPKTAGVARWIFLALWGAVSRKRGREGGDARAQEYVERVFDNVVVQPRDAREASDVFYKQRVGDVLLTYENEVVLTNAVYGDKALPYVVPRDNVRIECPISLVDKVVETKAVAVRQAADDFVKFLFTTPAQREFAKLGFRVNPKVSKAASDQQLGLPPAKMWSVDQVFGGWAAAQARFFDAGKVLDIIQEKLGRKRQENRMVATKK
uniref:Sulfate-binding protein n=1 Tax=Chlamydomonas leiostraca TaxID=1034604 RepID=A0A7S0WZ40_9CHLO|mmetsp:Transcript_34651/g.87704  ORF Transcript_34651/g.87704 Transcript_34651/m.87704 type:complete len:429 (+) Transcript_34651:78-1364(+)|eukprot:CAMPEP_0202860224 /NCGR_PEP_ID=MMETSP1391-20130828/2022_1 /ASSEMBLY_ACC=CAM_ASM_000867 /TAXON_ID=1034604 /ORGANISM="Chlamydomonas leiostraca, Strain SAG 11-49" /LENGTH=428 /DNA_ID=CAMNT_0049539365 /DNA_START=78 /DNA_END=1364 /DNA_ORIENTATION=+